MTGAICWNLFDNEENCPDWPVGNIRNRKPGAGAGYTGNYPGSPCPFQPDEAVKNFMKRWDYTPAHETTGTECRALLSQFRTDRDRGRPVKPGGEYKM
jgi:hypothetical protein